MTEKKNLNDYLITEQINENESEISNININKKKEEIN